MSDLGDFENYDPDDGPGGGDAGAGADAGYDRGDWESVVGVRWLGLAGALAIVVGVVLFVRLAIDRGLLGPPAGDADGDPAGRPEQAAVDGQPDEEDDSDDHRQGPGQPEPPDADG